MIVAHADWGMRPEKQWGLSLAAMLLIGFTMVTQLDASNTLVQRIVPDELRGRVMAIWVMMLSGLAPFGSLLVGFLAQHFSARRTLAAGGVACIMGAMGFGFSLPILQREARKLIVQRQRELTITGEVVINKIAMSQSERVRRP